MNKADLKKAMEAHRARAEELQAARAARPANTVRATVRRLPAPKPRIMARRPPFSRDARWMVISPISLGGNVLKPGQLVPADWPVMRLRRLHRSQQIGPIGADWTELMIRSWEDTVLARALAQVEDPKERELRASEWGAELEQRRASRGNVLEAQLSEERRAAEESRRKAQARRDKIAAEAKEREDAQRAADEAAAAEKAAEIERARQEEAALMEAERLARETSESQRAALGALAAAHLPPPAEPTNDSAEPSAESGEPPVEGASE